MSKLIKQNKLEIDLPSAKLEWVIGEDYANYTPAYNTPREKWNVYTKGIVVDPKVPFPQETVLIKFLVQELAKTLI